MVRRTKRVCQDCGISFYGDKDAHYCPDCAKKRKKNNVVRERICQDCGISFMGGPRARRCPDCRSYARRHQKHNPVKRPLGSIDKCQWCGAEYTVLSGRQKYCSDSCQRQAVLAWQRENSKDYHKTPKIHAAKQARRDEQQKICVYCLRPFKSSNPTNLCSDYCRKEQKALLQCIADLNRNQKRNFQKYEDKRAAYREKVKNEDIT